jgi:chloramphenicol O-acetyltransferase type A
MPYEEDFESYRNKAALCIARIKEGIEAAPEDAIDKQQSVFITTIPWFDFTSFTQPYDSVYGSISVITLGKYAEQNGTLSMAVALQVHHAVMDGYHAGLFYARLQAFLNEPEKCFNLSAILAV